MSKKGYKQTEKHKRKIGDANSKIMKEKWQDLEYRKMMCEKQKGHKVSDGFGKKVSERMKGNKYAKGMKPNATSFKKGNKLSEETKRKMSIRLKKEWAEGKRISVSGEKSPNWQGGKSFEPYSVDWTETLKRSIRERDKYTCQICGKEPSIHCHHIDYDKKNCNPDNLIILCNSCHVKTNVKRNFWRIYFRNINND